MHTNLQRWFNGWCFPSSVDQRGTVRQQGGLVERRQVAPGRQRPDLCRPISTPRGKPAVAGAVAQTGVIFTSNHTR
ncbi:MAG: hypothetical protein ABR615_01370, partial [Pseudonocardiaceae bacterium]